jgi:type IV pilus assembly protein PilF
MNILIRGALALSVLLLGACVTETTGGNDFRRSEPEALASYLQLASGYLEQGDLANAKRHLANASDIDPENSEVFAIWGLVYSREGEADLADQSFRRALRINARNSKARNNYAAFLFASDRMQDAFDQLQIVVEDTEYDGRPQAFENLGLSALRLERISDAETAFTRALQLNNNMIRSCLELVEINLRKPDLLQAAGYYRNYLTLLQFFNRGQNARSLWLGVQLETAFRTSPEYQQYLQTMGSTQ